MVQITSREQVDKSPTYAFKIWMIQHRRDKSYAMGSNRDQPEGTLQVFCTFKTSAHLYYLYCHVSFLLN